MRQGEESLLPWKERMQPQWVGAFNPSLAADVDIQVVSEKEGSLGAGRPLQPPRHSTAADLGG